MAGGLGARGEEEEEVVVVVVVVEVVVSLSRAWTTEEKPSTARWLVKMMPPKVLVRSPQRMRLESWASVVVLGWCSRTGRNCGENVADGVAEAGSVSVRKVEDGLRPAKYSS